jgi:hypothetical protein
MKCGAMDLPCILTQVILTAPGYGETPFGWISFLSLCNDQTSGLTGPQANEALSGFLRLSNFTELL